MKRLGWLAIVVMILAGVAYFGSPLLGWRNMREVARTADEVQMARVIDLPAVRNGLIVQLRPMFGARINADPRLANNPFAGLGQMLLPGLIGKMVDAYLTPQSIAVMVAEGRAPAGPGEVISLNARPRLEMHYAYVNRDLFRVTVAAAQIPHLPLEFLLRRDGLFGWTLIRIDLPPKALN